MNGTNAQPRNYSTDTEALEVLTAEVARHIGIEISAPAETDLAEYLPDVPPRARHDAAGRLRAVLAVWADDPQSIMLGASLDADTATWETWGNRHLGGLSMRMEARRIPGAADEAWQSPVLPGFIADRMVLSVGLARITEITQEVRRQWQEQGMQGEPPGHLLGPILRAWVNKPKPAVPFIPHKQASIPGFTTLTRDNAGNLPDFPGEALQLSIPGFEPGIEDCTSWILNLYDRNGGRLSSGGRLPLELVAIIGAYAHLPINQRDNLFHTISLPHRIEHEADWPRPEGHREPVLSVERWFHPGGGWHSKTRISNWNAIPEALERINRQGLGMIPIPEIGLGPVNII